MNNYNPPITAFRPNYQNLDADIGDLGECVQAPIARRIAPNVCSALAPPGACSQAKCLFIYFVCVLQASLSRQILIYQKWPIGSSVVQFTKTGAFLNLDLVEHRSAKIWDFKIGKQAA